jgi:hypothetical protein
MKPSIPPCEGSIFLQEETLQLNVLFLNWRGTHDTKDVDPATAKTQHL